MNFDFSPEQQELRRQARRFLTDRCTSQTVRAVAESGRAYDESLWKDLAALGWLGAVIPEAYGGSALTYLELCVIAEELGRALAPVPTMSSIYIAAELLKAAGTEEQKRRWLPGLAAGEIVGTLACTEGAGPFVTPSMTTRVQAGKATGVKCPVPAGDAAHLCILAARTSPNVNCPDSDLFLLDLRQPGVSCRRVECVDVAHSCAQLTLTAADVEPLGSPGTGWSCLSTVLDRAAVLTAFEQIGGADRALEMARDYALQRTAFARPIGSFQAIKHKLADMYVAATLARSNSYYGAWALLQSAVDLPLAAATARLSASKAFKYCAQENMHVHGGMGFTWELDCHLLYRRAHWLALTLGGVAEWEDKLVERLLGKRSAVG